MGGGGVSPAPAATVQPPTAADEEAAAERARLYALLRGRRGGAGLLYGARPRLALLQTKPVAPIPTPALAPPAPLWDIYGGGGGGGGGDSGNGGDGGESGGGGGAGAGGGE